MVRSKRPYITCFTIEELLRSTTIIEKERERSSAQFQSQLRRRGSFALRLIKAWKLARMEWEISFENQFWLVLNHREPTGRQARNSRGHSDPRHKCSMLWGILNLCIWFSGVGLFGICKASYPLQLALSCTLWPPWWHGSLFGNVAICHCSNFSLWQCRCTTLLAQYGFSQSECHSVHSDFRHCGNMAISHCGNAYLYMATLLAQFVSSHDFEHGGGIS